MFLDPEFFEHFLNYYDFYCQLSYRNKTDIVEGSKPVNVFFW